MSYTTAEGERKITMDRRTGSSEVDVWGTIPKTDRGTNELLAVDDPAIFAAAIFRDALIRHGVAVHGAAIARHRFPDEIADRKRGEALPAIEGIEIARRTSPPLAELLQVIDKVSQNLHAEAMLREVGAVKRNMGTPDAARRK